MGQMSILSAERRLRRRSARKVSRVLHIGSTVAADGAARTYVVTGQVFFASSERFVSAFDFREVLERVLGNPLAP